MAIHVDPNKYPSCLCFSQECPVIYRNFSGIIFLTIPDPFPTIPDHNIFRPVDNHPCEKTYINAFALFVPTISAALGIAFKASLMLCSHLHEQSGRTGNQRKLLKEGEYIHKSCDADPATIEHVVSMSAR